MKKYPHLVLMLLLSLLIPATATAKKATMVGNNKLAHFQQQAPADTLFYADGKLDWSTRSIDIYSTTSFSQMEMTMADLEAFAAEVSLPEVTFFTILLRDMMDTMASGDNKAFAAQYGLATDMASAFYLDGVVPVIQLAIEQPEPMLQAFDKAGRESGLQSYTDMWGDHQVHYWPLNTGSELGFDVWLTLSLQETLATIALLPANFSQSRRLDALGLLPETTSLADTGAMAELRKQQGYMDYMAGFLSLLEATRALGNNATSKTSVDMMQLFGNAAPANNISPTCRQEFTALATGVPRMVFGYDTINQQGTTITMDGHALLEINDQPIATQLTHLNGHLPAYTNSADDTLFAAALGLDVAVVNTVFNYLRSRLLKTDFACQQLAELKMSAAAMDPSALAMATAMAQGINGIGLALYNIDINDLAAGLFTIDGLVSIAANDPYLLAGLAGLIPELAGIVIPEDGSSVPLNLPDLPPGLSPKLAVKGKQLVIFDGNQAASSSRSMALEPLNSKGLLAISANYAKIGAVAQKSLPQIGKMTASDANSCADVYSSLAVFNDLDAEVTLTETFTPAGLRFDFSSTLHTKKHQTRQLSKLGDYSVQQLGEGCVWEFFGYETLSANGIGGYAITDIEDQCDLFVAEYNWQQSGATLTFEEQDAMARETCEDTMEASEPSQYSCTLVAINDHGFDCLFDYGEGDKQVYRYTREH
ncbi:MAG: hypothetical protein QGG88_05780 [Gammaproteobacteria bacterium]|jgi:hypothetical protein|nr:hypothetical protein [Gammaproteobacteria bacterium]